VRREWAGRDDCEDDQSDDRDSQTATYGQGRELSAATEPEDDQAGYGHEDHLDEHGEPWIAKDPSWGREHREQHVQP
jgi:hypothetical protein